MTEIKIESPVRYEKKSNKLKIETDKLLPNTCKVVSVGNLFRNEKVLVCMGKDSKDITIKPIKDKE